MRWVENDHFPATHFCFWSIVPFDIRNIDRPSLPTAVDMKMTVKQPNGIKSGNTQADAIRPVGQIVLASDSYPIPTTWALYVVTFQSNTGVGLHHQVGLHMPSQMDKNAQDIFFKEGNESLTLMTWSEFTPQLTWIKYYLSLSLLWTLLWIHQLSYLQRNASTSVESSVLQAWSGSGVDVMWENETLIV